jgi:hypothetical protein|tara:strand:- start:605 stop:1099 length:495 start_codon:yes stop_codon:yes gene_type:complete
MTAAEEQFKQLFEQMYELCQKKNWGDPFSYARSREIHIAGTLGHEISSTLSGADGIDETGECEYKSTISKSIQGTYNGISVQDTWEEQERYLREEKIMKYPNHYFVRYEGPKIVEIYRLTGKQVYDIIVPKLKRKFATILSKKDPRLGASVTKTEIKENGVKIL